MLAEACDSLWALSSLQVAVECGIVESLARGASTAAALADEAGLDRQIVARVLDVLHAYGFVSRDGDRFGLTEHARVQADRGEALSADIVVTFGQTRTLVEEARRGSLARGWRHVDPAVIRAQATLAHDVMRRSHRKVTELWPEIEALLGRDGAVMLDVGVGGGGAAVALCTVYRSLRVVGVDPMPGALAEARTRIAAHGLGERVELRACRAEEVTDRRRFDLAFVPSAFLDDASFEGTLAALRTALAPDGAILLVAHLDPDDPRAAAVARLRSDLWGGGPRDEATTRAMLARAGFYDVRVGPPLRTVVPIFARPPADA